MKKRQTEYTEEEKQKIWKQVCEEIANGSNLEKLGRSQRFPSKPTLYKWLNSSDARFNDYARARTARADARSDRIDEITRKVGAGKLKPDAARVMIDAEKWQAGKENSARYGDRIELAGSIETTLSDAQLESQLAKLLGKAAVDAASAGEGAPEETEQVSGDVSG